MALSSGSTLQQSDEVAAVVATSSGSSGGGGGAVSVVQNEVVAFPANGTPDRFRVSDTSAPEPQIQSAIDLVANNGGGSVVLGSAVVNGGYDPTSVTFDPSVLMEVDGQRGVGYNVVAYGAAGDGSSDDYPAFEATHNQAQAAAPGGQFTAGAKQRITIPQPTDGGSYLLGQMWVLEISSLEVVGGGKYGTRISNHSSFDSSIDEALISIGPLPSDTDPTVSSVVFRRLNVDGRGQEVSALRAHYDFSLNVENCTLRAGGYNQDGLGREVAGLHFRSGKNAFVRECQIASSGGHGILVDDRGDSGNNFTNHLEIRECLITENIANIRIKNGGFDTHITGGIIGGIDDNDAGPGDGHNLIDEGFGQLTVSDVWFVGGEYGVVKFGANRMQTKIENVRFSGIDRQSVADMGGNFSYTKVTDCTFDECGLDHDPNGSYNEDYTASGKVADIHFNDSFGSRYHLTNNDHIPDVPDQFPNRHSAVLEVADSYSTLSDAADAEHLIADNSTLGAGYRAVNGDEVQDDQAHYIDDSRLIFGGLGQESAGTGNKPTATDWEEGDIVENTDDDTLWLLLQDGSSWVRVDSVDSKVFVDLGNDGVPDIDPLEQIATTNDPQSVWSAGPNTEELLIDGNPLAYRAEDETITGQWQYEQEIDWTSQIEGVGYEGYRRIPVDSASQTEYILISKLDGNGNNQRLTADFYIGRTTGSSVNDHGQIRVYWNQSDAGSNRNFATETLMDVEGASEVFDARPVEVTYNGDQWAAVEVSVGFGNIRWRTLQPHHTGNYSLSVVESKSAANISNVTFWGDSSAGSLGRQELHVQRLQHDASRSHSFTSGFTGSGWTLETLGPDGKPDYMEAGHMVLRGTLRVRELILEQLRVRKGVQIISSGGGKLERVEASPTSSAVDANLGEFNAWDITGVDTSTNTVTVDNSTVSPDPSTLNGGQGVLIDGSAGNDDNYTVSSVTDNGDGTSDITMNESVSDSTADGRVWEATQQRFFFEAPNDTASAPGLQAGDRILAQRFDASNQTVVAQVRAVVERQFSTHEWAVTVSTNYTVPDIGQETEGYEFAVVASATGSRQSILVDSPFQPGREVLDGLADFDDWDNRADFLRMNQGNLNSRYDYTQEAYGMAAGDPDGVWISADDTKGVRMVDNTQGNQTVRAQLQGPSLTLGDTADDHIKIDPAGGLQMINDQGTEVARLNGTLLRLGSSGQIEFDPTASPEAKIQGTLQMGSGDIRAQTEGENSLLINGATSFSNGPTETQQDAVTQSFSAVSDSTRTSFLNSSTNPEYTHRLKITVDVASGATDGAEVRVDIDDASANDLTGELFVVQPGNATTRSVTFVPNSNSVDVSTRAIANGPNMTTVDVSYTLYDMPPLTEMTAVGMRVWKSGSKYITLGDGKIESDEYYFGSGYQLKRKGTDLFWIAPDGTETQIN